MARFLDAHIHLSDPHYAGGTGAVLRMMEALDMDACCVSTGAEDSAATLALAGSCPRILPFVGVHPERAGSDPGPVLSMMEENGGVIAGVGEIGLDPAYGDMPRQERVFESMLSAAAGLGVPVSIHSRRSLDRILDIMTSYDPSRALLHWFDGGKRGLARAMDMGFYVSYGPVAVYAQDKQSLISRTDPGRVLAETDGPVRFSRCFGGLPAHPGLVPSVVLCIARSMGVPFEEARAGLEANAASYLGAP